MLFSPKSKWYSFRYNYYWTPFLCFPVYFCTRFSRWLWSKGIFFISLLWSTLYGSFHLELLSSTRYYTLNKNDTGSWPHHLFLASCPTWSDQKDTFPLPTPAFSLTKMEWNDSHSSCEVKPDFESFQTIAYLNFIECSL